MRLVSAVPKPTTTDTPARRTAAWRAAVIGSEPVANRAPWRSSPSASAAAAIATPLLTVPLYQAEALDLDQPLEIAPLSRRTGAAGRTGSGAGRRSRAGRDRGRSGRAHGAVGG
jgi:hypothetical protein